jgi:AcrR family transcriptional regulator
MVGVVPNAAYRHFADRDELLAEVCTAAMRELADRMAAGVARVRGKHGDPTAARRRLHAIGAAYLEFARGEPGLFATAFAVPQQHAYGSPESGTGPDRTPLGQLRAALDELVDAGVLDRLRRNGIEYPVWRYSPGKARCAMSPTPSGNTSRTSPSPSSTRVPAKLRRHRTDELTQLTGCHNIATSQLLRGGGSHGIS